MLLGRKAMTNLDSILKSRLDFTGPYSPSCGFSSSHIWMWELDHKASWAPKNWCFWTVGLMKILESLGQQDQTSQSSRKSVLNIYWKDWCWSSNILAIWWEDRGWEGWMASPTRWTWVWVDSGSWWWTGRPGVLQFMGSQRIGHNWAIELYWIALVSTLSSTTVSYSFPFQNF